eukprot:g9109.t1
MFAKARQAASNAAGAAAAAAEAAKQEYRKQQGQTQPVQAAQEEQHSAPSPQPQPANPQPPAVAVERVIMSEEGKDAALADIVKLANERLASAPPLQPDSTAGMWRASEWRVACMWRASEWVESLKAGEEVTAALLATIGGTPKDPRQELLFARALAEKGSEQIVLGLLQRSGLVEKIAQRVWEGLTRLKKQSASDAAEYASKFEGFQLAMGGMKYFNDGLSGVIGAPDPELLLAMEREHCEAADSNSKFSNMNYCINTTSKIEWHFVACPDGALDKLELTAWPAENRAGLNAAHQRTAQPIEAFDKKMADLNERLQEKGIVPLQRAEVIGLRLYTGPMFMKYNTLLRGLCSGLDWMVKQYKELCQGNTYTTTVHVINSALVKLGSLTKAQVVYRGISGGKLPEQFHKVDEYNVRGGVETAFMSTTVERNVALEYAGQRPDAASMVMEIKMGLVDRGADLSWVSQYPHEREICFPPLCALEVTGTRVEDQVLVAAMRPNVNMKALTIEKVVARRKQMVAEMCEGESRDLVRELQSPLPQMVALRNFFGDRANALLGFVMGMVRERHHVLSSEPFDFYNRNDKMSSTVTELVEFGAFVKGWSRGVKNLVKAFNPNQLKEVDAREWGSDKGSRASLDLKYYGPASELPAGYLLLGHGSENDKVLAAKGPLVKPSTGWKQVWSNEGTSKTSVKYVVWMPTCEDEDFWPVGVVCVFGTNYIEEPSYSAGLVHRSCLKEAKLGPVAWKDTGTGASADLTLNLVKWSGATKNILFPSVATMLDQLPSPYQVDFNSMNQDGKATEEGGLSTFLDSDWWDLVACNCDDMEAGLLAAILSFEGKVKGIDLSDNNIKHQGLFALVYALLKGRCELETLILSRNPLGDASAPVICKLLRGQQKLKKLAIDKTGLTRVGKSLIMDALREGTSLEELSLRGGFVSVQELLEQGDALIEIRLVPGRLAGTDSGSGARLDLKYYEPEAIPEGFLMLGHGGDEENCVIAKGSSVIPNTDWVCVWTDAGSGNSNDYAIWLPTCDNSDYVALGVVCMFGTQGVMRPDITVGMVHQSRCKPANMGHMVWSDRGTGARADVSLNAVKWGAEAVNLMMPTVCTLLSPVPVAYAVSEDDD